MDYRCLFDRFEQLGSIINPNTQVPGKWNDLSLSFCSVEGLRQIILSSYIFSTLVCDCQLISSHQCLVPQHHWYYYYVDSLSSNLINLISVRWYGMATWGDIFFTPTLIMSDWLTKSLKYNYYFIYNTFLPL